jgi:hypothetical protein
VYVARRRDLQLYLEHVQHKAKQRGKGAAELKGDHDAARELLMWVQAARAGAVSLLCPATVARVAVANIEETDLYSVRGTALRRGADAERDLEATLLPKLQKQKIARILRPDGAVAWSVCLRSGVHCDYPGRSAEYAAQVAAMPAGTVRPYAPPCCTERMIAAMDEIRDWFVAHEARTGSFWAIYGSAIGILRNHGVLPWDWDVDFGVEGDLYRTVIAKQRDLQRRGWFQVIDGGHNMLHRTVVRAGDLAPHLHFASRADLEASARITAAARTESGAFSPAVIEALTAIRPPRWKFNYYEPIMDLFSKSPVRPLRNVTFGVSSWTYVSQNAEAELTSVFGNWRKPNNQPGGKAERMDLKKCK